VAFENDGLGRRGPYEGFWVRVSMIDPFDDGGPHLLLRCERPVVAHSVALNPFCQGLLIEGEADINAAAR
jgi:hypothetical protein